ncbi:hypothetical protein HNV11_03450 [Spirosoma taeanense]|uniref:Uncharacterized protein n=1 Tax=Spirosoma taeanense TaxID=2735870 RepID=A0A6M5Y4X0_9BACT|nr:hypothetical protein [Spirosoma taeanense]QJW88494.1 hypothetical protein HNV11_03450 [Spirosoma taeanense]
MKRYMAIHHKGNATTFTAVESVEHARAHLLNLLNTRKASSKDAMSIVETTEDKLLYYRKKNTIESLNGMDVSTDNFRELFARYIQSTLNQLGYVAH